MRVATVAAAIIGVVAFAPCARADAVADCAKIQGKALAAVLDAVLKEGARACVAGAGGAPGPVSRKTMGVAIGKYLAGIGGGIDKFGDGACGYGYFQLTAENIFSSAVRAADQVCLVP